MALCTAGAGLDKSLPTAGNEQTAELIAAVVKARRAAGPKIITPYVAQGPGGKPQYFQPYTLAPPKQGETASHALITHNPRWGIPVLEIAYMRPECRTHYRVCERNDCLKVGGSGRLNLRKNR